MKTNLTIGIQKPFEQCFAARWAEALQAKGVAVMWLDLLGNDPLKPVAGCDGVMWHWFHYPHERRLAALPILRVIEEHLHIPVFPNMATCWHYDDKIAQRYLLGALGIPNPKTWVFWRKTDALAWCENTVYPLVAKLSGGASSANVRLIRSVPDAKAYIEQCFSGSGIMSRSVLPEAGWKRNWSLLKRAIKRASHVPSYVGFDRFPPMPEQSFWMPQKNYALFQEFLDGNEFDTRITVIGNRAFAFRRLNRPNDFRASGSGQIQYEPEAIDLRCVAAAFDASQKLKSQSMAFDYLFRGETREPVVGEISYCYADWAVERCPGHWDSDLQWHEGHLWPEQAHVDDFLARIRGANAGEFP